eukprot:6466385-Amphidinium_carterae.1
MMFIPLCLVGSVGVEGTSSWRSGANIAVLSLAQACAELDYMPSRFKTAFWRKLAYDVRYQLLGSTLRLAEDASGLQALNEGAVPSHDEVWMWLTARYTGDRLKERMPLSFVRGSAPTGQPAVVIETGVRYQTFLGFGGSFTQSSADLFSQLSVEQRHAFLDAYFSKSTGLGYRLGRLHMNSCDFSRGHWSCSEVSGDVNLDHFNMSMYEESVLPMVRQAQDAAGENIDLLASPWSPPAWMKTEGSMVQGGKLLPEYRAAWAKFYVRFAEEMQNRGCPLWAFTVQNEPQATTPWENCLYSAEEERDFVRDFLGPTLHERFPDM